MNKNFIECTFPIKFSLKPNFKDICFTRESLGNIPKDFKNAPIVKDGVPIGILTDQFYKTENEEEIIFYINGWLFAKCFPEMSVNELGDVEFNFTGVNITL